jgi:hypothetical protein
MLIKHKGFWTRNQVSKDSRIYLFGDNELRVGNAGQAVIRGLPNAIGVATKKLPSMGKDAFWSDAEYARNCAVLDADFAKIPPGQDVVISENGLGTGLAMLDQLAPKTFKYLQKKLEEIS